LLFSALLLAQDPNLGASGAQFLKIPLGAKESGMGGGVIALTDDAVPYSGILPELQKLRG